MTIDVILMYAATLGWGVLCGAMIYEHVAMIPQWAKKPPESLAMWTGEHRVRAERFWMSIHPILLLLLGATLATSWSDGARRELLFYALGGYAFVIATTAVWFVPELMTLTRDPKAPIPADEWGRRARRWEALSLARGALLIAIAVPILRALALTA